MGGRRAAFLDRACADDPVMRQHVESLLKAHDEAGTFIDEPAVGQGPPQWSTTVPRH